MVTNISTDFSLPVSTLLRTGTAVAHQAAENSQGGVWLTRGELDREEYVRFLVMLWHIYDTLERGLEQHASHSVLQPTYNPTLLARAPSLALDISFLLQVPESSWQSHPINATLLSSPPQAFVDYTSRLRELSESSDPSGLLAHAYVRYLGDLSGGQIIRRHIAKAYGLDAEEGSGVMFYDFKVLGGNKSGTIGDLRKIKEWYRDGMNAGVGDNKELKGFIVEEANAAFVLNSGLFATLRGPNRAPAAKNLETTVQDQVSLEQLVVQQPPQERLVSIGGVVSLVAAVGLAHFLLVIGGFTGDSGYNKLLGLQNWLHDLFQAA